MDWDAQRDERWLLICLTFIPQASGSLALRRCCARDAQRLEQASFQPYRPQAELFPRTKSIFQEAVESALIHKCILFQSLKVQFRSVGEQTF